MPKTAKPRALIVTCMRDAGPFILEWLAHHKAIGFTDFLIYSNDLNGGEKSIWIMRADGTGARRISARGGNDSHPAWSGRW